MASKNTANGKKQTTKKVPATKVTEQTIQQKAPKYQYGSVGKKIAETIVPGHNVTGQKQEVPEQQAGEQEKPTLTPEQQEIQNKLQDLVKKGLIIMTGDHQVPIVFTPLGKKVGMGELIIAYREAGYTCMQYIMKKMRAGNMIANVNNRITVSANAENKILRKWIVEGVNEKAYNEAKTEIKDEGTNIFGIVPRKNKRVPISDSNSAAFDFL